MLKDVQGTYIEDLAEKNGNEERTQRCQQMKFHVPLGIGNSTQQFEKSEQFLISLPQQFFLHLENEDYPVILRGRY